MARIFITGSSDGIGLLAGKHLIAQEHKVVLHARSKERAETIEFPLEKAHAVVTGDLSLRAEVEALADQVNALGPMDAIIHNAGVYAKERQQTDDGFPLTFAVNVVAPYLLTAMLDRPSRLIYLGSNLHFGHGDALTDPAWQSRDFAAGAAYGESKLMIAALAAAIDRRWQNCIASTVDPGWVPTRMGGAAATDSLEDGFTTQAWLAVSEDRGAQSGGYWHQMALARHEAIIDEPEFQDNLLSILSRLTGVTLPE